MRPLGVAYRYWITLIFLAVVAQIAAAAYGAFYTAQKLGDQHGASRQKLISEKLFDHGFSVHVALGYVIFLAALVLPVLALAARLGARRVLRALAVPIAVAVQIVLAWASESVHAIGILHGVNALVVFALTGYVAREAWRPAGAGAAAADLAPSRTFG